MKIVIIGGGKVGYTIASQLAVEGHDITVVENDKMVADEISDSLDCMTICGNGGTLSVMREAGTGDADLLIACTAQDELNMLCCMMGKKLGCKNTIARVRNPEYAEQMYFLKDELNLSMSINPELTAAREIFRCLEIPGVLKREPFAGGQIEIVEVVVEKGSMMDGKSIVDVAKSTRVHALICAVKRENEIYIPGGSFAIHAGDKVHICAPSIGISAFLRDIGAKKRKAKDVLLIGAGRISGYLCSMLEQTGIHVKVIEADRCVAEAFAEKHPNVSVICGDAGNENVLKAEHAGLMDAVISLTGIDEENLIYSMYMRRLGVKQVITKVDHIEFSNLISDEASEHIISPKKLCSSDIIRYVRAIQNGEGSSAVITMHYLIDGKMEALEFNVTESTKNAGMELKDIHFKPGVLIASINRKGKIIIPGGLDTIEPGDTVVVVAASEKAIIDLNSIFEE